MKENTGCSFNEEVERHSTLSLIDCGDACCDSNTNESGGEHSDFGAWSNFYFPITDRQFLNINISVGQRKNETGTRKTVQSKYYNNPAAYIARYKHNRALCMPPAQGQSQEESRDTDLSSKSTGRKCHHQSATGDNREKIPSENKIKESVDKKITKRCSR